MGLIFRGKHSLRDIGVATTVRERPFLPPPKTNFNEDVPYMDGSIDFSQTGGRIFYKDKILEVDFALIQPETSKRNKAIERFAAWIAGGKGELVLDDMPRVKWIAYPITTDDMQIQIERVGKCTVEFRCEPFNNFMYSTYEGIPIDSDFALDSDIPIGWGEELEISNGENIITVANDGSAYVRPVIEFFGSFNKVIITHSGGAIAYKTPFRHLEIDCERFAVFEETDDVTAKSDGEFLELAPGDNEITISAEGNGIVYFDFTPKYFYDTQY